MQPLHPDDSRLTAYVLGELAPEDAAAIERAAAADTGLRTKIQEITDVQDFLTGRLAASADPRLPRQRENIRRNPQQTKSRRFASLQIWIIPAAAVVVLALAFLVILGTGVWHSRRLDAAQRQTVRGPRRHAEPQSSPHPRHRRRTGSPARP